MSVLPVYGRPPWRRPGPAPAPLPGVCRVWWARPYDVGPEHDALLADADLLRRARLARAADRQRLTAAAAVTRLVLGTALGTSPAALRIDRTCPGCGGGHGKPRLLDAPALQFSVSHSGSCIVVAVLPGGSPVGVDVEVVGRFAPGELDDLAHCTLATEERAHLAHCPAGERPRAFTGYWVRKEAALKATGQGLTVSPDQLVVTPPGCPPRVLQGLGGEQVWLCDLAAPPGFAAALAGLGGMPPDVVEHDAGPLLRQTSRRLPGATTRSQRNP